MREAAACVGICVIAGAVVVAVASQQEGGMVLFNIIMASYAQEQPDYEK